MRRNWLMVATAIGVLAVGLIGNAAGSAPSGRSLWTARYDGVGRDDVANAVTVAPDGAAVFVAGRSDVAAGASDALTVAYDARGGATLWEAWYHGRAGGFNNATALVAHPAGDRVFVTGESLGFDRNPDLVTLGYDATSGARLWTDRHGPDRGEAAGTAITVSPDGSVVYVTGQYWEYDFNFDYVTLAYDAMTGKRLWRAQFAGPAEDDRPAAIAVSPDGSRVFVTGGSILPNTNLSYATVAYDAGTGEELWVRHYAPSGLFSGANDIAVGPGGNRVYVTGSSVYPGDANDVATLAYRAADGQTVWESRYDDGGEGNDVGRALAVDGDGSRVFVTGTSGPLGESTNYLTMSLEAATGKIQWLARQGARNGADDIAWAVAVDPDRGRLFVTGESWRLGERNYLTVAYDRATGQREWVAWYGSPAGIDAAVAVAVGPAAVYVTGLSQGRGSLDAVTIAYRDP